MKLIYDIGMYDASDTKYYLSEGYRVVAVEANPVLIDRAKEEFGRELSQGQLILVNAAISDYSNKEVTLNISGDDLGSSSIYEDKVSSRNLLGSYTVRSMTIVELTELYGDPYYLKVDIEGADKFCVLPLTVESRPTYISFEVNDDIDELVTHLEAIGFTKFKAINQCNFMELNNQETIKALMFRIRRKIISILGFKAPRYVYRNDRFFLLRHSAGPAPWASDGGWFSARELLIKWTRAKDSNKLGGWYDVHAM